MRFPVKIRIHRITREADKAGDLQDPGCRRVIDFSVIYKEKPVCYCYKYNKNGVSVA
jgi:hypothetical protein